MMWKRTSFSCSFSSLILPNHITQIEKSSYLYLRGQSLVIRDTQCTDVKVQTALSLYVHIYVEIETALPLPVAVINVSTADYSTFKRNQVLSQEKKKDLNGGEAKPSATQICVYSCMY